MNYQFQLQLATLSTSIFQQIKPSDQSVHTKFASTAERSGQFVLRRSGNWKVASIYLVRVPSPRLQPLHDGVEDEPRVPPADAVVRRVVAHVPPLVGPRLRERLLPLLLAQAGGPVPDEPPPVVAAHEQHPHLIRLVGERQVQLRGPRARSLVGHIAGDGGAAGRVGERVAVLVNARVLGRLPWRRPPEEAELVGRA